MNSIKEYKVKVKKLGVENKKQAEKISHLKKELTEVRKEKKYLKRRVSALIKSRDNWKVKNATKRLENKQLKAEVNKKEKIKRHHFPKLLVVISILLRIKAGCSYGSIVKILKILNFCFHLELTRLPCENSIQNWVSKMGLYCLFKKDKGLKGKEVSLIIDESIKMGQEKQLLVLAVPYKKVNSTALQYQDVEVLHIEGAKNWKSESVEQVITSLTDRHGFVLKTLISDEASNLKKASRLCEVVHIPDIAHAVATCLKKTFKKDDQYQGFTTLVGSYKQKGVNQSISYLCPPRQGDKARFMNQQKLTKWANKLLVRFTKLSPKGKIFFSQLSAYQPIIKELETSLSLAKAVSLPFKKKGLSTQTVKEAEQLLKEQEEQIAAGPLKENRLTIKFISYLKAYVSKYKQIIGNKGKQVIHVSTEIIESLFGKYKSKAYQHSLTGLTKLNLEIPLYCMSEEELMEIIPVALENVSMTDLDLWIKKHSSENQLVKRIKFFSKKNLFS